VTLYDNVAQNIMGEDRDEMFDVWDDDERFDRWLKKLDKSRSTKAKSKGAKTHISQDEYLDKFAKVYGGEEDGNT
jgi:predicted RNA-binding Zn ribbon-like protein